jgi:diguanylate cyclase (GGDEF)-like protein/PAS domain S-box-containing protein
LALNQSSELYDFSPVGSVLIDAAGAITKLNLTGAQLLSSERARLIGSRFGLYVAETQRAQFNAMLARARLEHEAQTGELSLQVDGQGPSYVQIRVVWVNDASGWQIGLVDVSERRRMEEQLRGSEERLTLALSAVGDGVMDWQVSSGEVLISKSCAELLGFAENELLHQIANLIGLVHPDDKPLLMQKLQKCLTGKTDRFYVEQRAHCGGSGWKWLLLRGAVVYRSEDAQALRIVGTLVDVTKNVETAGALAAAAKFQQAVFDSISAQIAVLDQAGTIMQTNTAWQRCAAEVDSEESVGRSYLAVLAAMVAQGQEAIKVVATGIAAVAGGELSDFYASEPIQAPCGQRWFTIKVTPVNDEGHRLVVTHEDVSVLKRAELASRALANVDTLTGAMSRQHFLSLAEQELARAQRYELPLVVLMLDLDLFKHVNDTYGHSAGDAVLQSFVQTVTGVLRESDTIGRIGGEEFAVMLPNTTKEGGRALANRILEGVRSSPVETGGKRIGYTVSIGAGYLSGHMPFAELLAQCDAALYRAKNSGRDRLEVSWEGAAEDNH